MPIGLVSQEDFEKELNSYARKDKESHQPIVQGEIIDKPSRGRSEGDNNVPESLRKIIGEEAVINGRQSALQIARDFGISSSSVSAYAKGATSTSSYDSPAKSLISHINKSRQRAIKKASSTLNAALGSITQEKLDYADAKDLSAIAKDMSVVIKNLEPPQQTNTEEGPQAPQFVIFAPQFRDERSFDTINVSE